MPSLPTLFAAIAQAQDLQELRSQVLPRLGEYFVATRWGLFFFDQLPDSRFQPLLNLALSLEHNPVLRYLVERHAPVHEGLVVSPQAWQLLCPRTDHRHVMAGPLVKHGNLVGGLGFTRSHTLAAFDRDNLADLSGLCLHLSTWIATGRSIPPLPLAVNPPQTWANRRPQRLTRRETQIAQLVAMGKTNAAIGAELWITENSVKQALKRMFQKLQVSNRTEMIAQLLQPPKPDSQE